ncbi:MAG: hypothetical protein KAY37_02220 [Phycisphaerae bacterium]|nr:hypothetical protein [Phycisphaerae bacterium]
MEDNSHVGENPPTNRQVGLAASTFLCMAKYAYHRSTNTAIPSGDWTAGSSEAALASIVFSWIALECFINEVPEYIASTPGLKVAEELRTFASTLQHADEYHSSTALKYQIGYALLSGTCYEKGAQPYKDFDLLRRIRNALMHYKADVLDFAEGSDETAPKGLVEKLYSRSLLEHNEARGPMSLVNRLGRPMIAAFAHNAALNMIKSLIQAMPKCDMTEVLSFSWKDWIELTMKPS